MKKYSIFIIGCLLLLLSFFSVSSALEKDSFATNPTTNKGKKWRIGYYQGGDYIDYSKSLLAMITSLMELGWIEPVKLPPIKEAETNFFWDWLADTSRSEYIQFVKNAYYNADWNDKNREKTIKKIIDRLNKGNDLDLMIALGTWAGQDLSNEKHHTPTMVLSTSDPLASGIIKSIEDSGYDHIHARIDPFRYERQIQIFHEVIGFKKLGIAYENTTTGKSYAAITQVEKIAKERDFDIIRCFVKTDDSNSTVAEESVKKCFSKLALKSDAIYATIQPSIENPKSISELVKIVNQHEIPTFSQSGSEEVRNGFLLSISKVNFYYVGRFYAETMAKIFNGAKPRQLDQVFEHPPKIAINLKTAEIIGYDPPLDVLGAADEIFQEIQSP